MTTYVTFRLDGRAYATRIESVREVVRLGRLVVLPGMAPPLAGVLDLRGVSLPVVDVRPDPGRVGDIVVLELDDREVGFACDAVTAVLGDDALVPEESRASEALPNYVEAVLRGPDGPVFLVDLKLMAGTAAVERVP